MKLCGTVTVMCGGVWSQATGEALEGAECIFTCAFDRARATLESARKYLDDRFIPHGLPEPKNLEDLVVEGVTIMTQQDHAPAQLAQESLC